VKFEKDTIIIKEKRRPEEVLFVLHGEVMNMSSKRVFTVGSMIGETDIYFKRVIISFSKI